MSASIRCPKCSATSGGDWSQCKGACPMPLSPHYAASLLCAQSHYAAIVDAQKDVEIYQLGDIDCPRCLQLMGDKHQQIAEVFRARLRAQSGERVQGLCHECEEMVDVVDGKLDPHHGTTGDGCSQNGATAQIYLHPKVAALIAEMSTALVFGGSR